MKIGRERQPLSERLAEKLETETSQAAVWLESHLQTFRSDCAAISKSARDTIEHDIAAASATMSHVISENTEAIATDLQMIQRMTQFGPWVLIGFLILSIGIVFATTYWWGRSMIREAMTANYQQIGLATHFTQNGLVISWDQSKLSLSECSNGKQIVPCLITKNAGIK
ncbi:hypothetical protein [Ochrobactrum sp. SFR4]|uniref:hypothetical protein n=1 Tax=Ochrobactrum sp. SFR4 TaxID=2717368 RepID=UPI00256FAE23|nr:hypothetical protein [Ochrobactrum sp. SFR4]